MLNSILSSGGRELPDGLAVQGMAEGGSQGSAPGGSSLSNAKGDQDGAGQEAGEEREAEFARWIPNFVSFASSGWDVLPANSVGRGWRWR